MHLDTTITMKDRLIPGRQARAALLALLLASALCVAMVAARSIYARNFKFLWIIWNLFLAWIPLLTAMPLYVLRARGARRPALSGVLAVLWLLFFPNAPYIVTDFVHLIERPPVPFWFDMITILAFGLTGLFLGYLSLYLMQELVRSMTGRWTSWAFAFGMLALGSFGIYLGRFVRWNSWDVLLSPVGTLRSTARMILPVPSPQLLGFSVTFFAFSLVCYLIVYSFTHLHAWVERTPPQP
ncbi:MAG TPA: DUF1361 domain-containing protein [Chthoniobacteraceae bacterium]|nr:DUF1361 domain-containing protein [Chthoniobacteraceae bacterium]